MLFMNRLQFGFYSVLARLDVEVDYADAERAIQAEIDAARSRSVDKSTLQADRGHR